MAKVKVRYKGASDIRILPADQLAERGVKGIAEDLVFGPNNMWAQEVEMSDELEAILRQDGAFVMHPVTDDGGQTVTDVADPLQTSVDGVDDTGNTVVMADTGQTAENKADEVLDTEAMPEPLPEMDEPGMVAEPEPSTPASKKR